jgi:Glyoxalase-like domain
MTRFKELCLDVNGGGGVMGEFWAAATGCVHVPGRGQDDPGDVVGEVEGMGIALCPVPEPRTVKHRVHLDVHTDSVDTLLALGATLAPGYPDDDPWTVLLDPQGGELCAFVREEVPAYKTYEVVVDSVDCDRIARWWGDVLGVEPVNDGQPFWYLKDVAGMPFESFVFDNVPEPKTVKNRLHWDVYGDVDELLAKGATHLWDEPRWTVLADPEGNEFCVFPER